MKNNIPFSLIVIFMISIEFIGCCSDKFTTLTCADGNPVRVLKDVQDAYPQYAYSYDLGVKANIDVINKVNIGTDIGYKETLDTLRQSLNQESSRIQQLLIGVATEIEAAPCDKVHRDKMDDLLSQIADETSELNKLSESLKSNPTSPDARNAVRSMITKSITSFR
jgi:hypothetical protein